MSDIYKRFETVRESFGLSQRGMALELGLSKTAWAAYESGKALPSYEVLQSLRQRGIDLNWLFDGGGSMRKSEQRSSEPDFVEQAEERFLSGLKLGRMALSANSGTVVLRGTGLDLVMAAGRDGLSLAEINSGTGATFSSELLRLIDEGIVQRHWVNGEERFSVSSEVAVTLATEQDRAQAAVEAIEFFARKVVPAAHAKPSHGVYLRASVHVDSAVDFLRRVKTFFANEAGPLPNGDGNPKQTVNLLFGGEIEQG